MKYMQKAIDCNIGVKDDYDAESLNFYFFEDYIKDNTVNYNVYFNSLNRYYNQFSENTKTQMLNWNLI